MCEIRWLNGTIYLILSFFATIFNKNTLFNLNRQIFAADHVFVIIINIEPIRICRYLTVIGIVIDSLATRFVIEANLIVS